MIDKSIEKKIKYKFNNPIFLETALTHSSYTREQKVKGSGNKDNERLEFLGDAFFDAIISTELFRILSKSDEGRLTKTRAKIVCEKSLVIVGENLEVGKYLNLGKGEERGGGRSKPSIIADAVEAIIGAIYLDGGYEKAYDFVKENFSDIISKALKGDLFIDYKSKLQENLQKKGKLISIKYILDKEEGPSHAKTFYVHLECNGEVMGKGFGKTKKEAEQRAAKATLEGEI